MMRVGVIGINHKLATLNLRETLAKACQKRFGAGKSTHGNHVFILLSTCNRTELYFSSDDLPDTHSYVLNVLKQEIKEDFDQKLYSYFGQECFHHLIIVATGLDSAIMAETEIQGQVRHAYEATIGFCHLPASLHYLFQKSLKISKMIRAKYPLGRGKPNLEHAIFQTGVHLFKSPQKKSILFVGASEINQKVLEHLKKKECDRITICNRSSIKAEAFSTHYQIAWLPWTDLMRWPLYDWIIVGTKAPCHLISENGSIFEAPKLIVDLSLPRNVDPLLGKKPFIQLLNIDQINRMLKFRSRCRDSTLFEAEQAIVESVQRHSKLFSIKQSHRWNTYVA
jgi:glutamyl-tRNA reductase